jgi:hypothetical protein
MFHGNFLDSNGHSDSQCKHKEQCYFIHTNLIIIHTINSFKLKLITYRYKFYHTPPRQCNPFRYFYYDFFESSFGYYVSVSTEEGYLLLKDIAEDLGSIGVMIIEP